MKEIKAPFPDSRSHRSFHPLTKHPTFSQVVIIVTDTITRPLGGWREAEKERGMRKNEPRASYFPPGRVEVLWGSLVGRKGKKKGGGGSIEGGDREERMMMMKRGEGERRGGVQ